jgi:hypothetical protein
MNALVLAFAILAFAQDAHHDAVDKRGDHVMGFSHEKATHHFRLYKDGGAIEVAANDAKDTESRDQIQMHLGHIAKMFADGDFKRTHAHSRSRPAGCAGDAAAKGGDQIRVSEDGARRDGAHHNIEH